MALHLLQTSVTMYVHLQGGLNAALEAIEDEARSEFGIYQPGIGAFPAWPELADSTKDERVKLGYSENEPLLRSGELRDSSQHEAHGLEGVTGSTDPVMGYQEFGTAKIPARPVWGPAALKSKDRVQRILGAAVVSGLFGGSPIHPALGYNYLTR